jgi:hypothetical protein
LERQLAKAFFLPIWVLLKSWLVRCLQVRAPALILTSLEEPRLGSRPLWPTLTQTTPSTHKHKFAEMIRFFSR